MADLVEVKKEPEDPGSEEDSPQVNATDLGSGGGSSSANNASSKVVTTNGNGVGSEDSSSSSTADAKDSSDGGTTTTSEVKVKVEPEDEDEATASAGEVTVKKERTEDYDKLIGYGLDTKVASRLDEIYQTGKLTHSDLDERALDALKEFPVEGALAVLAQFLESNLEHVSNKSAYLCGVMKTYRQKTRSSGSASGLLNGTVGVGGSGAAGSVAGSANGGGSVNGSRGPDETKIKEILDRTGYTLDVTTGQRKYGGPPPGWEGDPPGTGCEVFCGKIPRDLYEDELIPLFEKCGKIWDLRLMMDPMTGLNRGYAFVTFTEREAAQEAVRQLDLYDLGDGKLLKVNVSEPKTRLFIGNIPKSKGKEEIEEEFNKLSAGLKEVIIYSSPDDKKKNRGFCFLEYESHKAASLAKRRLETGRVKVWSCDIIVDWADPQEEPDEETMSQVKVLYVRNLTAMVTEERLREVFEAHGKVERVKKIKDYAFIHFEERKQAIAAMDALNRTELQGSDLEISLAKPPSDKKKKEEMLRKREQRMMKSMAHSMALPPFPPFPAPFGPMGAGLGLYRGGGGGHLGGGRGGATTGAMRGGMHRGYENAGYYNAWGGWGGDASWTHHPHQRGGPGATAPMSPWLATPHDNWGHHQAGSGAGGAGGSGGGGGSRGQGYNWNGSAANGASSSQGGGHSAGGSAFIPGGGAGGQGPPSSSRHHNSRGKMKS